MTEITLRNDFTIGLIDSMANDKSVLRAMLVASNKDSAFFETENSEFQALEQSDPFSKKNVGRINALMRDRHGCYDDQTEVLTDSGWKPWPEVNGLELFATLNLNTDQIEYQRAIHHVRKHVNCQMIHIKTSNVDCLVTPDHNMLSAPRTQLGWEYGLYPAYDFLERSHRIRLGGGLWDGDIHCPEIAELIGFIVADGYVGTSIDFHLTKSRKIDWLRDRYPALGITKNIYRLLNPDENLKQWAKQTYTAEGDRCFPRELLERGDAETIRALLDGYLFGDGNLSATGKIQCSTVSRQLVDDIQEASVKADFAAIETSPDILRVGAYGNRPLYRLTIYYRNRNSQPRIGWTNEARQEQVSVVDYSGEIHCVTVPNGTLYVRRNGKVMWCGNTPFEHNAFIFYVEAPIFVFREWHRHRIGISINEQSGRYSELPPMFYIPPFERPLIKVEGTKQMEYHNEQASIEQYRRKAEGDARIFATCYEEYLRQLEDGIVKESARNCLPVAIYSKMYWTCNARSLMAFLSLRTRRPPYWEEDEPTGVYIPNEGGAKFPSKPLWEIDQCAQVMEQLFHDTMPITHEAFDKHGRVAP